MPSKRKVKLFGYELTMTSALLLFISSVFMLIASFVGLYFIITAYNDTGVFPVAYFMVYTLLLIFGAYVFMQTTRFRRENSR